MQADLLSKLESRGIIHENYCFEFCKNINEQKNYTKYFWKSLKKVLLILSSCHLALSGFCGYIAKKGYRGHGTGFYPGKYSIDIAQKLGYKAIIFNLVFKENNSSLKLGGKLCFLNSRPKSLSTKVIIILYKKNY